MDYDVMVAAAGPGGSTAHAYSALLIATQRGKEAGYDVRVRSRLDYRLRSTPIKHSTRKICQHFGQHRGAAITT